MSLASTKTMEDPGVAEGTVADPDFIVYLLDPEQEYNCYFVVGNSALGNIERIGVVKKMLVAHSLVLRAELQDSKIAEKNDVKLIDIFPHTFKNLLRFVYGFDNTETLSFDDADNLLYAADKYMIPKLKNKLATRLMSLLDASNICSLMNNPACYTVLELNSAITEILQIETDQVLASPQFLDLSSSGFLKILEQEMCNVEEIELWRAAIKWANNKGKSEENAVVRKELTDHLRYIRFCAMAVEDLMMEVIPTKVLTYDEIIMVIESRRTGEVQPNLTTVCNVLEERERPLVKSELLEHHFQNGYGHYGTLSETTFTINTHDVAIELHSVQLVYAYGLSAHRCNSTITFQKGTEPPIVARFDGQIDSALDWTIPILSNGKTIELLPKSSYSVRFSFACNCHHQAAYKINSPYRETFTHYSVDLQRHPCGSYVIHCAKINYKTLTKKVKSAQTVQ